MSSKGCLTDTVIQKLENMIADMNPGDRLPTESTLAEQFAVGRSTIRESLKVLSYNKRIVRTNEGTFVAESSADHLVDPLNFIVNMDVGNVLELIELREMLELLVVRMAVRRASEEDITALEKCDWMFREPGLDRDERRQRDFAFHNQLAKCGGNAIVGQLLNAVRQVIAKQMEEDPLPEPVNAAGGVLHEKIISAIRERDESEAVRAMEEYLLVVDYNA
ncbi:MAG: FadR family transcriptional regulator [Firmicutes bacterium]|nr:FadR family transcriptional regulator [Bacillota bacterium]